MTELIDYAMPMMKIEKLMRQIHDLCLEGSYDEAGKLCLLVAVESRFLGAALAIMESKRAEINSTYPKA
jgi:hypothetical protein